MHEGFVVTLFCGHLELCLNACLYCRADVFNILDIMENGQLFEPLKFGRGDGNLQYYLYNWRVVEDLKPAETGLVLL